MARILVVDDDPAVGHAIVDWLSAAGHYSATTNAAFDEAFIEEFKPELLIVDILMPERDGIEVIEWVRGLYPTLKIIAMSGGGRKRREMGLLKIAETYGANGSLEKPFLPVDLYGSIEAILTLSAAPEESRHVGPPL